MSSDHIITDSLEFLTTFLDGKYYVIDIFDNLVLSDVLTKII